MCDLKYTNPVITDTISGHGPFQHAVLPGSANGPVGGVNGPLGRPAPGGRRLRVDTEEGVGCTRGHMAGRPGQPEHQVRTENTLCF